MATYVMNRPTLDCIGIVILSLGDKKHGIQKREGRLGPLLKPARIIERVVLG